MITTNYLVIGSGVAGLTFAVKMAERFPDRTVTIITKSNEDESNTKYAQGGVAVVLDHEEDSFQNHIKDTLIAGDGLCDKSVVTMVIKNGPQRFKELIHWGTNFDINSDGNFDLGMEGGHSEYRVAHHKDITGYEIERALLQRVHQLNNITLLDHHFAIDLITEHHLSTTNYSKLTCYGAYVLNEHNNTVITIKTEHTLLATGGIGQLYGHTTNPTIATGDGIAMAYRAKAQITDMEFVQFHPTVLYTPEGGSSFLISEAVRGFGAYLRDKNGNRFMKKYDARAELASRDIVSQSIDIELKQSKDTNVYLDCTHLDITKFIAHFPNIYNKCLSLNINIATDWIPVVPASHYLCGGIVVNGDGQTSIHNLYACGECSRTGLHGANRLASNSLLEALVYANNIFTKLCNTELHTETITVPEWKYTSTSKRDINTTINSHTRTLQLLMRTHAGITRNYSQLDDALLQLENIYLDVEYFYNTQPLTTQLCELRNMINGAYLIIKQSIARKTNKGGYYNTDII
ncbi:MAG: L-aspartate oxidase [Flavobacteriaceae bacterium]